MIQRERALVVRTKRFSSSSAARYFLQWLNQEYAMMLFTPAPSTHSSFACLQQHTICRGSITPNCVTAKAMAWT